MIKGQNVPKSKTLLSKEISVLKVCDFMEKNITSRILIMSI